VLLSDAERAELLQGKWFQGLQKPMALESTCWSTQLFNMAPLPANSRVACARRRSRATCGKLLKSNRFCRLDITGGCETGSNEEGVGYTKGKNDTPSPSRVGVAGAVTQVASSPA
jgi:hypothetical protein